MTNETRSPKEIEREIEEQRSDLTSNLEDLQDKFSLDTVVRQISDQFREHGGDMGRSISNQVKANPLPLALTGIGLAWLMFGNSQQPRSKQRTSDEFDYDKYSDVERDFQRDRKARGMPYTAPTSFGSPTSSTPPWAEDDDLDNGSSVSQKLATGVETAKTEASSGIEAAKDSIANASTSARGAASSAAAKIGDAAASVKSTVGAASQSGKESLSSAGSRIAEGTEALTEEGRQRVIAARQKAMELRRSAARSVNQGTDAAADFYDQQPLVVGALALAVGAALGGALPRTKAENDLIGSQSDNLFEQAERIFEEEKAKALSVAGTLKDEVKDIAAETKADLDSGAPGDKSAVEAIGDMAKDTAKRVTDKAKSEAQEKDLGKPKT